MKTFLLPIVFFSAFVSSAFSFTLHPLFTDQMVIQRDTDVKIFGKGEEGEEVTVEFAGQKGTAKVTGGKWKVVLKPVKAGGPYAIKVSGKDKTVELKDVLVGDVWVCGGQSNMQTSVGYYFQKDPEGYKDFMTYSNHLIRLATVNFSVKEDRIEEPSMRGSGGTNWFICESNAARGFSGTGYYFGKRLQENINIPVGLLSSCVGGTPAEAWVPKETLKAKPVYAGILSSYQYALDHYQENYSNYVKRLSDWSNVFATNKNISTLQPPMSATYQRRPNGLFNGMIAPIVDFPVKGFVWYQGEDNSGSYDSAQVYRETMSDLIRTWRKEWGQGDLPFYQVILAAYQNVNPNPEDRSWPYLRESQLAAAKNVPNAFVANIIDTGLEADIHPPAKHESGERLADVVKGHTYGTPGEWCGPVFKEVKFEGPKATLTFDHTGSGLMAKEVTLGGKHKLGSDELKGFAVCGEDEVFKWAKAEIQGNAVVVSHPDIQKIISVRYAWANFPLANLFNKEGYPAYPFRTDDWSPNRLPVDIRNAVAGRSNLALGRPWKSSNANALTKERGIYGGLTDGQYNTEDARFLFSTDYSGAFPKDVTIELGSVVPVDTFLVFNLRSGGTKTVEVALSKDGATFTDVGKNVFANYSDERWVLKLPSPVDAAFVRIRFADVYDIGFGNKPSGHVFLREVMVFGK